MPIDPSSVGEIALGTAGIVSMTAGTIKSFRQRKDPVAPEDRIVRADPRAYCHVCGCAAVMYHPDYYVWLCAKHAPVLKHVVPQTEEPYTTAPVQEEEEWSNEEEEEEWDEDDYEEETVMLPPPQPRHTTRPTRSTERPVMVNRQTYQEHHISRPTKQVPPPAAAPQVSRTTKQVSQPRMQPRTQSQAHVTSTGPVSNQGKACPQCGRRAEQIGPGTYECRCSFVFRLVRGRDGRTRWQEVR